MKNVIAVLFVFGLLCASSFAGPTVTFEQMGYKGTYDGFSTGNIYAGELIFTASDIAGVADGQFISFCIEGNESVHFGNTYDAILNTAAVNGGFGGGNPDSLSNSTAWLYNYYLDSVVGNSNNTIAKDYQLAIWYLEGEISNLNHLSANAQSLVNIALEHEGWNNTTIKVLNLYAEGTYGTCNPVYSQDCMVRVSTVPVPGAVLIAGFGTVLLGWIRRRKML